MDIRFSFNQHGRRTALFCLLALLAAPWTGCGGGGDHPPLGQVSGLVTLNGQPLADADVTFQPEGPGRASIGTTDSEGRYELIYLNDVHGALIGPSRVMITTARSGADDGSSPAVPEKLPPRYHEQSTERVEVVAGKNTFDFDLNSE